MPDNVIEYEKCSLQTLMEKVDKIEIPIIQRDYAFGRKNDEIEKKCKRFITNLSKFEDNAITLDIIYGNIEERKEDNSDQTEKVFVPLDGQQRLTTLFLLYYFAMVKDNIDTEKIPEKYDFLKQFSYFTRIDSKDFCEALINHPAIKIDNDKKIKIKAIISDQHWFQLCWETDPTVSSMLNVLDCIQDKFKAIDNLWDKLNPENQDEAPIQFYYLNLPSANLNDELYIKMNSTGKQLTTFEIFKVELEQRLRKINNEIADKIAGLIDGEWTDLLWHYRKGENGSIVPVDSRFLNYFKFIFGIMSLKNGQLPIKNDDEYELFDTYFDKFFPNDDDEKIKKNIDEFQSYFDCWIKLKKDESYDDRWEKSENPEEFFKKVLSKDYSSETVKINGNIDLFQTCVTDYDKSTFNQRLYLYTVISYLKNNTQLEKEHFLKKFRCIRNLILNSSDRLSLRAEEVDRLKRVFEQIDFFMLNKNDEFIENDQNERDFTSFNEHQIYEEKLKRNWIKDKDINIIRTLYKFEDHDLLRGQIGVIGLNNISEEKYEAFEKLFKENDKNKIARALMTIDDYSMNKSPKYRVPNQDNSNWIEFFHKSTNENAWRDSENNRQTLSITLNELLNELLNKLQQQTLDEIIAEYPDNNKDWRYYYIKYPKAFDAYNGYFHCDDKERYPFICYALSGSKKRSSNSWQPILKAVVQKLYEKECNADNEAWKNHMSGDGYGLNEIIFNNSTIKFEWKPDTNNENDGRYVICLGEQELNINYQEDIVEQIINIIKNNNN